MIDGVFRDGHPRISLRLPGVTDALHVEFIVDTGFDGDLALPGDVARLLDAQSAGSRARMLADGSVARCPCLELQVDWNDEERLVEVLVIEGRPLIGTQLLTDCLLTIEVIEGGEVAVEVL